MKTPIELGIDEDVHRELLKLRDELANGLLEYAPLPYHKILIKDKLTYINMADIHCGSVGCLYGHLKQRLSRVIVIHDGSAFEKLCGLHGAWEAPVGRTLHDVRPNEIVRAIDNFMNGSQQPWRGAFDG